MATIPATKIDATGVDPIVLLYEWVLLADTDVGAPVVIPHNTDIQVQILTRTGSTITWQGSLDTGASPVYGSLHRVDGTVLTQNAAGQLDQVLEAPILVRPVTAGGAATVRLKASKQWRD